jgi:hypothetical protein
MSIRRRCAETSCTKGRRCLEHLVFDMMWQGRRHRVPVNTFAIAVQPVRCSDEQEGRNGPRPSTRRSGS